MFNEELAIEIGEGILGWHQQERVLKRFGSVSLFTSTDPKNLDRVLFSPRYKGYYSLATTTIEIRESPYMSAGMFGKRFLKQRPGIQTILGEGELFYPDAHSVGVKPRIVVDGMTWLHYESLISLHNQTVKLFLIPSLLS